MTATTSIKPSVSVFFHLCADADVGFFRSGTDLISLQILLLLFFVLAPLFLIGSG